MQLKGVGMGGMGMCNVETAILQYYLWMLNIVAKAHLSFLLLYGRFLSISLVYTLEDLILFLGILLHMVACLTVLSKLEIAVL